MKLRFTPRAARDLVEIADYVREHSPQASLIQLPPSYPAQDYERLFDHTKRR